MCCTHVCVCEVHLQAFLPLSAKEACEITIVAKAYLKWPKVRCSFYPPPLVACCLALCCLGFLLSLFISGHLKKRKRRRLRFFSFPLSKLSSFLKRLAKMSPNDLYSETQHWAYSGESSRTGKQRMLWSSACSATWTLITDDVAPPNFERSVEKTDWRTLKWYLGYISTTRTEIFRVFNPLLGSTAGRLEFLVIVVVVICFKGLAHEIFLFIVAVSSCGVWTSSVHT